MPSQEKFLSAVRSIPAHIRVHVLLSGLTSMLTEQLEYVFMILGEGPFRSTLNGVKREISEPLAKKRDLVKKYGIENDYYRSLKRAEKVVHMVRGD